MLNRRQFNELAASILVCSNVSQSNTTEQRPKAKKLALGFDNFSLRALGWKANKHIDFAAQKQLDSVLFSDLDVFENHSDKYLSELKSSAADAGISIQTGTGGICPTSSKFIKKWGTAKQHLSLCLRIADALGSSVVRCYLGHAADRTGPDGIEHHIQSTVETLQSVRTRAKDLGIKFAVENHAGDMQAHELADLIQRAGADFVGATMDSGNSTWTLEHPMTTLEVLGPFALSTGIRDSMVWQTELGADVAWTAMGEGVVDWSQYFELYEEICPNVPVQLEIISGFSKAFNFNQSDFWSVFPNARAQDFARFVELSKSG